MYLSNDQIELDTLPKIETVVYQPLEKRYRTVLLIGRAIFFLISALLASGFVYSAPFKIPRLYLFAGLAVYLLYILWTFLVTLKGFQHKSFALREKDVIYRSGWLWRYVTTAPFNRVQHVRIDQGPIERRFNLARLKIYTAGGTSSDLTIPGLDPSMANDLKEFIVKKTLDHGEEE